jgi:hypothetical protein
VAGQLEFLRKLAYSRSAIKSVQLIVNATFHQLECLVEIGFNFVHGTVQPSAKELARITPYLRKLKKLSVTENVQDVRKLLITRDGIGLMPVLLKPVITMIERQRH